MIDIPSPEIVVTSKFSDIFVTFLTFSDKIGYPKNISEDFLNHFSTELYLGMTLRMQQILYYPVNTHSVVIRIHFKRMTVACLMILQIH